MDSANAAIPSHPLEAASVVPIAELCPDLPDPASKAVGGVVTITWPYNKVQGTFAFSLAEPDFRLRRNKGQVRIEFTGRAAKAVGDSGLASNDVVLLSLAGVAWEAEATNKRRSLPGADVGWRLIYSETLSLSIKRAESNEIDLIVVDEHSNQHQTALDSIPIPPLAATEPASPPVPLSPVRTTSPLREPRNKRFNDSEFASPAFVKRARMSYGSLFEDGFDIFQDDGGVEGRGRKRTRFGRDSSAWRYTSRSPTPEPATTSPQNVDKQASSPSRAASSSTKVEMANEGCQTMELDQSSPRPPSAHSDIHIDMMVTKHEHKSDATPNVSMESVIEHGTKTPPTRTWPPESSVPNARPLISSEFIGPNLGAPPSHSDQQLSPSRDTFTGIPWNMEIPPPHLGQQQKTLFTPSHVDESFAPSGFGKTISAGQPAPFDESDSLRKTRSVDFEDQASTNEEIIHSTGPGTPAFNYPPLDPAEDTRLQPNQDDALTNYPSSYLESGPSPLPDQVIGDQQPVVTGVGLNSWATVNHNSNFTTIPPTDRLGSRDGDTPEQALVIDESDSDSDSDSNPEPMAVEDTINEGRAYALGMCEDVEAEDEVDAQYSDDDEPEYDVDEMGGDYDTRIYERPDDDDDGGDDEDIGPRPLDSEFGDEESWDEEEEEDLLDEDNEAEFETDVEMDEPDPQPVVRTNPTVIDLISSSEDESEDADEDEDEGNDIPTETQQPSAHIDSRTSPSRQQILSEGDPPHTDLNDDESDIISQAPISEANISSEVDVEDHENMSSHYEEEEESENEGMDDDDDDESEDQDEDIRAGAELKTFVREEVHVLESPEDQAGRDAEESAALPFSAADGLETLSHVIDEESSARSHSVFAELSVEKVVIEAISDQQLPAEPPEDDDDGFQIQDSSDNQLVDDSILEGAPEEIPRHGGGEDQVEQTSPPVSDDEHPHNRDYTPAALSSPPLTQSFQSHVKADSHWVSEEITVTSAAQIATTQLPTPLDTQVTNTAPDATPDTFTTIAESFDSYTTIYQSHSNIRDGSALDISIDDLVQQDISMSLNFDGVNQEPNGAPVAEPEAHHSAGEQSTTSSPAPSFQTQVDDGELAWSANVEQAKTETQLIRNQSPEDSSDTPDRPESFISQMEIDEELQASILEYSQLEEEYTDYDIQDGYDASSQGGTHETDFGSEQSDQAEIVPSPLHDDTPARQLAEEISMQLRRNFVLNRSSSGEDSDTSMRNDPSVHLARAANASKRTMGKRAAPGGIRRPRNRVLDAHRSPTPETDNSSIHLARASLASQTPRSEEDSGSMTAAKLQLARHLRDELPDCASLKILRQHLTKSLDVIAVAVMQPPDPQRAKAGPREYMMSFTISDYSIGPYKVAEALIYRPHKDTLPIVKYGDIVLLRNFTAVSLANKGFGLRTNDASSWAVFDHEGEPPQIRGPPVEYSDREVLYVSYLREWFSLLDDKARERLEDANQKIIAAGRLKVNRDNI